MRDGTLSLRISEIRKVRTKVSFESGIPSGVKGTERRGHIMEGDGGVEGRNEIEEVS